MKRKDILPYIMAICGVGIFSANADADTATYRFPEISVDALKIDTVSEGASCTFAKVAVEGYTHRWEDGEPMVPVRFQTIKVPAQTTGFKATVKNSRKSGSIRLGHPLIPGRLIPADGSSVADHPYRMSGKGYGEIPTGPEVKIENDFYANGTEHYIVLGITPFVYDCVHNALDIYSDIDIELSYEQMRPDDPAWAIVSIQTPTLFDLSGKGEILELSSGGNISTMNIRTKALMEASSQTSTSISDYLILVPEKLKDACTDLVTWKMMKGYNVNIVTFEEIYNSQEFAIGTNSKCFDRASSVREWLKSYQGKLQKLFYCLIVGDESTTAPSRKYSQSYADVNQPSDEYFIPSDMYFSDLYSNWTHTFQPCRIHTIDVESATFSPKNPVGRLICSEGEEVRNYIRKLLIYEAYPGYGDMDYLNRGIRVQHPDNISRVGSDQSILKFLNGITITNHRGNRDKNFEKLVPTSKEIIEDMSQSGIYTFQTHGGPLGFKISDKRKSDGTISDEGVSVLALTEYWDKCQWNKHVENIGFDRLNNNDKPSVLYSLACNVAYWDTITETNRKNGVVGNLDRQKYNPASAFTVAGQYGGVAFLGNSRPGYWGDSNDLEEQFSYCLQQYNGLGIIENNSKINYKDSVNQYVKNLIFKHNLIGDPDIRVWLKKPELLNVVPSSTNTLLNLRSGFLRKGEIGICCKDKNSLIPYQAINGRISIPISYLKDDNGNIFGAVSVRQQGYLPYIQLLSDGSSLNNYRNDFILKELKLEKNEGSFLMPVLNLGENCQIKIKSLTDITSNEGISVGSDSTLKLESDAKIILIGDKVSTGGCLDIRAKEVEIGFDFNLSEGAEFRIDNK